MIIAAGIVNWEPSLLVSTIRVVIVEGAVSVVKSENVSFDQCCVTPPATIVVSDCDVFSNASVMDA